MHVIGAKAVALAEALTNEFRAYQIQVIKNARTLGQALANGGVRLVAGGTDNHMMLTDLTGLGITGRDAENALGTAGITVNKNAIPFDRQGPTITSGVRIGTPAVTSRGMGEVEMENIGRAIVAVMKAPQNGQLLERVRREMLDLCAAFPIQRP